MPVVRYKNVSITVYPLETRPGYWQFRDAKGKRVTRADEKAARAAARQTAFEIFVDGGIHLTALDGFQLAAIRRMVDADPSCKLVDEFLVWHARQRPAKDIGKAIEEFLSAKEGSRGRSAHNVQTLTRHLSLLPGGDMSAITPQQLAALFPVDAGARTRRNIRGAWVTFFRWARRMGYLPVGEELTAAERLEKPIVSSKIPETYTPAEMAKMLRDVDLPFLPWLVLSSFAGIRSEEISPSRGSSKSPLDWSDFHWDRDLIIIRPETDKNGRRRVIPILPVVKDWLLPLRKEDGMVGTVRNPAHPRRSGEKAETTRLGEIIGGWRRNAPRHSFISYRAAIVGISQTAAEAGNSESEAKKSYNDAKGADEAKKWFSLTRRVVSKLP